MKPMKKAIAVLCAAAVLAGAAAFAVLRPAAMPALPSPLYEEPPAENGLRTALEVNGVEGCRFFIQSPKREALQAVSVAQFGASPEKENNAAALNEAFAYCAEHPGTLLQFEKGVYYVADALKLNDLTDVCIDGNGAKLLYSHGSSFFTLRAYSLISSSVMLFMSGTASSSWN